MDTIEWNGSLFGEHSSKSDPVWELSTAEGNRGNMQITQQVSFPTDVLQELLWVHAVSEREAVALFMEHSFKDDRWELQKSLMVLFLNI